MSDSKLEYMRERPSPSYFAYLKKMLLNKNNLTFFFFMVIILTIPSSMAFSKQDVVNKELSCNCVIFRLDDLQEGALETTQIDLLNLFISKNASLSLGLIMDSINNTESPLLKKIIYGSEKNLFEIVLHGFHHVDYSHLTAAEQKTAIEQGNDKMQQIFGKKPITFIPPYNSFNSDTLYAMNQSGIKVISAMTDLDNYPIFIAEGKQNQFTDVYGIYHMPEMTSFENYTDDGQIILNSKDKILKNIYYDLPKYGYSVITLHPESFAIKIKGNSSEITNADSIQNLSDIIDDLNLKKISTTTFSKVVEEEGNEAKSITIDEIINNSGTYSESLDFDTWSAYGDKLQDQGKYQLSLEAYRKALQINPHDVNTLEGIGLSLSQLGNYTQAIPYFDKALQQNSTLVEALNLKGDALYNTGNISEANIYFNKVMKLDPNRSIESKDTESLAADRNATV